MTTPFVYGIPNCDTVRRARAWLTAQGVAHRFIDFKKLGMPATRLDVWLQTLDWQSLVNRQGSSWRKLPAADQAAVTGSSSARALMLAHPSVVKRPVVEWPDGRVTVGFVADEWRALLWPL